MNDRLPDNQSLTNGFPGDFRQEPVPLFPTSSSRRDPLRRQQALVAIGRRVVAAPEVKILFEDAAAMIAEMLDAEQYLVAELLPEGAGLRLSIASRPAEGAKPETRVRETSLSGNESLAGFVLQVAHPVVVNDLARETRFDDPWLRRLGVASALAVPMKLPGRAFGALAACSNRVRPFEAEDILFTETITHLVTAAVARIEAEKTLQAERQLAAGVLQTVGALVLVLDHEGRIRHINRACEQLAGFAPAELKGRPIWDALFVPDELGLFQLLFQKLREGISPVEYEGMLLTKHSQQRHIAWSYSAVTNAQGELTSILATGIDISEQRNAEQRAARAEEAAARARQAALAQSTFSKDKAGPPPAGGGTQDHPRSSEDSTGGPNRERRRRPRRSYPYRQLIAPILDGNLPPRNAFVEIECNDIAAGGFSYLASQPPPSDSLVVALGVAPKLTHLSAEVAHVTRVKRDGRTMYLIGCTYTGRIHY